MRESKNNFRHDSLQDTASIRDILQAISDGFSKGKIVFRDEDDRILMKPEGLLDLKIRATQTASKNRFSIRISWQNGDDEEKKKKKRLTVSSE